MRNRLVDDLGKGDRPLRRLALGRRGVRHRVILRLPIAALQQALAQPLDHVMVLGVDHDHGPLAPRGGEHVEYLAVVEPEQVVGHVDLERRVAVLDEGGQLLADDLVGRIGDDQVEGVVDDRVSLGAPVVGLDHGAQRVPLVLGGEGDDRGVAAARRRDRARAEVVRGHDAERADLGDVAMAVDAAREHQLARGVDGRVGAVEGVGERHDPTTLDADVALDRVGGRRHRPALDDQVELSHGKSYLRVFSDPSGLDYGRASTAARTDRKPADGGSSERRGREGSRTTASTAAGVRRPPRRLLRRHGGDRSGQYSASA